jgi:UDP-glucose 4-epimerase
MFTAIDRSRSMVNVFNLGTDEFIEVDDSIAWITSRLAIDPVRTYTGGDGGWIGDSPFIFLDTTKIRSLGWKPKLSIREGIIRTLDYLRSNLWLLEARA